MTADRKPHRAALVLALLLAALLAGPSPSRAAQTKGSCAAHSKHARACAGSRRPGHSHHKTKSRHAKPHRRAASNSGTHHAAAGPVAAPPKPATCEDGSRPVNEGDGSFSCADGSEPICKSGAEPVPAKGSGKPVCPAPAGSGGEWSEAECEDGGTPERAQGGGYTCEDGSQPVCTDESRPTASEGGSMLVCIAHGSPGPSSPSSDEEDEAGEDEDSVKPRAASAS